MPRRVDLAGRVAPIPYALLPLAAQRRLILQRLQPIENAYAGMHPEDPAEPNTNAEIDALYRELEHLETKMANLTARSIDGLIEQMEVLKAHIGIEAPEREPLAEAVLRGLRALKKK